MFDNPKILLGIAVLLAAIPIAVWLYITIKKEKNSKKIMLMIFSLGCLTAPALLALQIIWAGQTPLSYVALPILILMAIMTESATKRVISITLGLADAILLFLLKPTWILDIKIPKFDLVELIEKNFSSALIASIFTLLLFAAMEENIKLYVMRSIDRKTLYIAKINDAMRYCIAAALGFSFAENVYYLYSWWPSISTGELASMYFFRSILTTAAHMTYSGILGYYYGVGKFSMIINQQNLVEGKKDRISEMIAKIFNFPPSEAYRQKMIFKGLFIATGMHFSINFMLELQQTQNLRIMFPLVVLTTVAMYLFLEYLLKSKAGHLILLTDPTTKKTSSIGKKDEEVVVELLSMWLKDRRYVDVIHICERLLERDPDNNVVKLFKAKAMDEMDEKNIYKQVLGTVIKTNDQLSGDDKSVIAKYVAQKETIKKAEEQNKKEEIKTPTVTTAPQQNSKPNVLENFTGDGTFKI